MQRREGRRDETNTGSGWRRFGSILLVWAVQAVPALGADGSRPHRTDGTEPATDTPAISDGRVAPAAAVGAADPAPDGAVEAGVEAGAEARAVLRERLTVVGDRDAVFDVPGSAHYVDADDLERHRYDDAHRILRQIPGINLQDEEGFGLRPNIGMRGTGVERSQKVTLMEDGILIAPAPYAAPAAYYFPVAGRMQGVEVRKGSAAIRQGPFTTGGALNMISREIPGEAFAGGLRFDGGRFGDRRGHLHAGGAGERFGWFLETVQHENDGFKTLDGGGDTGFRIGDYLGKFRWNTGAEARRYRSLEVKLGVTDQDSEETYLGLTESDFARSPYRRYAGSQQDRLTTDHRTVAGTWFQQLGDRADWTARVYRNDFSRNWRKLDSVGGDKIDTILEDPLAFAAQMDWIRGDASSPDDAFRVRNNRRDYYSEGIESIFGYRLDGAKHAHAFEIGVRLHRDEEDRFQEEDGFAMDATGRLVATSAGAPGSQANRIQRAEAIAVYLEDRWSFGRWTVTPGLRVEDVDFERLDFGKSDPLRLGTALSVRRNSITQWVPGLGASRTIGERWGVFGSAHRGFSPPGPGATQETRPETSWNYEAGVRWRTDSWTAEATVFYNDYENLLGRDTLSGGGTGSGDLFNAGEVEIRGLEAALGRTWRFGGGEFPVRATYSYTRGAFDNSFDTTFADWAPRVEAGDRLPYLPEHQAFVEAGWRRGDWETFLNATFVDDVRTRAGRGPIEGSTAIEDHVIFDLSVGYRVRAGMRLTVDVRNLTDEVYLAARRPAGLRPGLPRAFRMGVAVDF